MEKRSHPLRNTLTERIAYSSRTLQSVYGCTAQLLQRNLCLHFFSLSLVCISCFFPAPTSHFRAAATATQRYLFSMHKINIFLKLSFHNFLALCRAGSSTICIVGRMLPCQVSTFLDMGASGVGCHLLSFILDLPPPPPGEGGL